MTMRMKIKRMLALALALLMLFAVTGCASGAGLGNQSAQTGVTQGTQSASESYAPTLQPDGQKLRIGLLDIDPYEPASIYFYYVVEGLKNAGWVEYDELPFTSTSMDVKGMMQELSKMDLGDYVEFGGDAVYYLAYEEEADIASGMAGQIEDGLDVILAMGTDPGLFMKAHPELKVNTLVCMATDPIASGIINSVDDSGDPLIWAQVEPSPYYRQIKFYHKILPFENIGMVYTEPVVSGIPDYQNGANELGITITGKQIDDTATSTDEEIEAYTKMLLGIYEDLVEEGVDAYMLNADLISGSMDVQRLLQPFDDAGIPVFVQDGENYVRDGALLLVASTDNQGVGQFVASVIGQVANGVKPGDIDCEYISSPYMSINLDAAKRLGFRPSFEMLLSCETIYSGDAKGGAK